MSARLFAHTASRLSLRSVAPWMLAGLCGTAALAQPSLVLTGLSDDISADGNKCVGFFFDYAIPAYVPFVWQRGVGYTQVPGSDFGDEVFRGSSDLSIFSTGKKNASNWGNLNCFNGYCAFDGSGCVLGTPLPPPDPCIIPSIAHRYTSASGWVNTGSVPRLMDAGTGRFFGGTRCDSTINAPYDISGNGNVIVGGAWSAGLLNNSGGPNFGVCGDFVAFQHNSTTGMTTALPVQPGTTTSRADTVNNDGTVITGYDLGMINDPAGPYEGRRICVWTNNVQTLLNDLSGSFEAYMVNGPGNFIAGTPAGAYCVVNFEADEPRLVRWTRQLNNSWSPTSLGRVIDWNDGVDTFPLSGMDVTGISDDGNTIVGLARYGSIFFGGTARPFIWRPSINGGVPIDFTTYLASIAPGSPILQPGFKLSRIKGLSADGNAISVSVFDERNTCTPPAMSLSTGNHGILYLNGAGVACDQPRIALQPRDFVSTQYTPFGVALNIFASGTFPMTYTWQREDATLGWVGLAEACAGFPFGGEWDYEGVNKNQLRVGQANCGGGRGGRYRVIVSNSCGTVTSEPATVSFAGGTLITQQPEPESGCPLEFLSVNAVAVSNSPDLSEQWEVALASSPANFTTVTNGAYTFPDGRTANVFGATGQFMGITANAPTTVSNYLVRCRFLSPCGDAVSNAVTLAIGGSTCFIPCDSIDFNNDEVFPDSADITDFLSVFAGGACSNDPNCHDIDFNNDAVFPDSGDIESFLTVFGGGAC